MGRTRRVASDRTDGSPHPRINGKKESSLQIAAAGVLGRPGVSGSPLRVIAETGRGSDLDAHRRIWTPENLSRNS